MSYRTDDELDGFAQELGLIAEPDSLHAALHRTILRFLLDAGGNEQKITADHLTALRKRHPEITKGVTPDRLGRVLTALNRHGWECVIPPKPVKPPRPVALPETPVLAKASYEVMRLEQMLRREGTIHTRDTHSRLFLAALYFVTRCGAGDQVICGILSRLRVIDIDETGFTPGRIRTPIHGPAEHGLDYEFIPPEPLRSLLIRQKRHMSHHGPNALVFREALEHGISVDDITDVDIRGALQRHLKVIRHTQGIRDHAMELPRTWSGIVRAGRWLPRSYGVPPAILEILSAYPLPKKPLGLELFNDPKLVGVGPIRIPSGSPLYLHPEEQDLQETIEAPIIAPPLPSPDWSAAARIILRRFLLEVETRCSVRKNGKIKPSATKALDVILTQHLDQADEHAPSQRSLLHLGLHWLAMRLGKREITISSARTYLSRVFQPRLFDLQESTDMGSWDEETIDEMTILSLQNPRWSAKSQKDFLETWFQFLRFCAQEDIGVLSHDDLNQNISDPTQGVLRGRRTIITPFQFDHVLHALENCHELTDEERNQNIVVLILGFYGGLRSSEVRNLTLADIVSTGVALFINIRRSKTEAGRRAIPMHRLLPDTNALSVLRKWAVQRQDESRNLGSDATLGTLPLFGPLIKNRRPRWDEVIAPAMAFVHRTLHINIDFHGLRHSAASWLLLRSYAAYYPDFSAQLQHGSHACFQAQNQSKLRGLFEVFEPTSADGKEKILVHIAKFLGHANLRSLMLIYGHTIGVIHSHALRSASTKDTHAKRVTISKK